MDAFHLPPTFGGWPDGASVEYFYGSTADVTGAPSSQSKYSVWSKPRGKNFLGIFGIGGAGGGGGGAGNTAGAAKGGGGGSGSANLTRAVFLLSMLPDSLYVAPGHGGLGGAGGSAGSGSNGSPGVASRVMVYPAQVAQNILLQANASGGGSAGTQAAGGAAGGGGSAAASTACPLVNLALFFTSVAGMAGSAGGAQTGAAGSNLNLSTGTPVLGGTGGGGSQSADFAGGNVPAIGDTLLVQINGGAAGANSGVSGFWHHKAMYLYGGTGGGASNSATGGAGGNGRMPGAGAGGGGGGTTVGGRGGDGGPGLIIMACW